MVKLSINFKKPIEHMISQFQAGTELMNDMAALGIEQIEHRFDVKGDPGEPWPELAPSTQKTRRADEQMLQVTGNYRSSHFPRIYTNKIEFSMAPNPQGKVVHQDGFEGSVNIPSYQARVKQHKRIVKAHNRRTKGGKVVRIKAHVQKVKSHIRSVPAHSIQQKIPARPSLRFTDINLSEFRELIIETLGG